MIGLVIIEAGVDAEALILGDVIQKDDEEPCHFRLIDDSADDEYVVLIGLVIIEAGVDAEALILGDVIQKL